jgi:hypothetical protein
VALQEAGGAAAATASDLGQGPGRPGFAVGSWLGVGGLQPHPDRRAVGVTSRCGQGRPLGAGRRRPDIRAGRGIDAVDAGGWWSLARRCPRNHAVAIGSLGGQAGDLAGVTFEAFQHGQHGQRDCRGDSLGDQVGVGVGDVAADGSQGAAGDEQPAVARALGAAAGAADDAEHVVDGRPIGHHRDRGRLPSEDGDAQVRERIR